MKRDNINIKSYPLNKSQSMETVIKKLDIKVFIKWSEKK